MIFSWIVILLFIEQLMVYFEENKAVIRGKNIKGKAPNYCNIQE